MAVAPIDFLLKPGPIQVVCFQGDMAALEEIRDWLSGELGPDVNVELHTSMGRRLMLTSTINGVVTTKMINYSQNIVKDANGQFYAMDQEILEIFYALAP